MLQTLIHAEHAAVSTELLVLAPVVHAVYAELAECGRAHHARLDGDVEDRVEQGVARHLRGERLVGEDVVDRLELGMARGISEFVGAVASAGDDGAVPDEDTADGDFAGYEGVFCLGRWDGAEMRMD